jgi:uncharacterized membrane protein
MGAWPDILVIIALILFSAGCIFPLFYLLTELFDKRREVWHSPKRTADKWLAVNELLKIDPAVHNDFILEPKNWSDSCKPLGLWKAFVALTFAVFFMFLSFYTLGFLEDLSRLSENINSFSTWLETHEQSAKLLENFLLFIPAGLAFLVALLEVKANLTANNRKKWIEEFRESVTETVLNIPDQYTRDSIYFINCRPNRPPPRGLFSEHNKARTKLELLINPTEPDHRVLSTLIRFSYGITDPKELQRWYRATPDETRISFLSQGTMPEDFRHIIIVDFLVYEKIEYLRQLVERDELQDQNYLISLIFRLSNAVLKREWERVKKGI